MIIQMLGTHRGVDKGDLQRFDKDALLIIGEDIGHTLACHFLHNGLAKVVDEDAVNRIIACPYLNSAFSTKEIL